jgi:hypothetical protein
MHKTVIAFALKHRVHIGRAGDTGVIRDDYYSKMPVKIQKNLYYIVKDNLIVDISYDGTAKSAIALMKRYLRSKEK